MIWPTHPTRANPIKLQHAQPLPEHQPITLTIPLPKPLPIHLPKFKPISLRRGVTYVLET